MTYLRISVQIPCVLYYVLPIIEVHVNVKVRHGNSFRVQKSFKNQVEAERVYVRYSHCVGDKRPRS